MQTRTRDKLYSTVFALGALSLSSIYSVGATADSGADTLYEAIAGGKAHLNLRLRFENVEQDNALSDASLLSVRSRLGYETAKLAGFGAFLEFENTTAIGNDDNFSVPGASPFPAGVGESIIADPEFTETNQAFISYSGFDNTVAKYGRQRIILDNARFIGNVGWRQNEQTFDAFSINNTSLADTSLTYAFISNVNNIVGLNTDVDVHALNASYSGFSAGKLTGYAYLTDFETADANDNQTIGIRFSGSSPVGANKILYTAEIAQQSDSDDNPSSFDHDYLFLEGGVTFGPGITAKVGYELLGSDDGNTSFFTPFATLHKFQGWADVFLGTSTAAGFANGVEDLMFTVSGKAGKVKLLAVYHDFSSDEGGIDYGTELDLLAATSFGKFKVGAKYAAFNSDDFGVDTDKFWLWAETKI